MSSVALLATTRIALYALVLGRKSKVPLAVLLRPCEIMVRATFYRLQVLNYGNSSVAMMNEHLRMLTQAMLFIVSFRATLLAICSPSHHPLPPALPKQRREILSGPSASCITLVTVLRAASPHSGATMPIICTFASSSVAISPTSAVAPSSAVALASSIAAPSMATAAAAVASADGGDSGVGGGGGGEYR